MVASSGAPAPFHRRLLVVEDEPLTSSLLLKVLTGEGFNVASASTVVDARALVSTFDPDCALIDISLGTGPSGVDLAHMLSRERPDIALLFLTRHPDLRTAGLSAEDVPPHCGFVRKDLIDDPGHLVEAIEQVLRDQPRAVRHDTDPFRPLGNLSEQQLDVLRLVSMGYTNEAIGRMRGVGPSTVERWVAGILKALGIDSRGDVNPRVEATRRYVAVAGIPSRP